MKAILSTAVAWVLTAAACYGQINAAEKVIELVGDETKLVKVKATPHAYIGNEIILTGIAKISDYYDFGYRNSQITHNSIEFREALGPLKSGDAIKGERCHLYLRRVKTGSDQIPHTILAADPKWQPMRAKVTLINRGGPTGFSWATFELIDAQFPGEDGKWGEWHMAAAAAKGAKAAATQKELERARLEATIATEKAKWRKWTSANGKFQTEAKFLYTIGEFVVLRKFGGKRIKVRVEQLSKEDQEFIRKKMELK